jgi:alginate O-acetyltransferase complex protein AlgJ
VNPNTAITKPTGRGNSLLVALFMILLWLPTLDEVFHLDRALAYNEKRLLADLPSFEFGLDGLKHSIEALQTCFNDHFGFRLRLLRWYNQANYRLFGNRVGSGVITGHDGWLFYAAEDMVEQYRGVRQFTPEQLLDWQQLLEGRRDWLAARGSQYIFVIAPDKQSIYPEKLPDWLTKVRPETKLDQFLAYMRAHSTVEVLDLRPALREANQIAPTYLKTDTHWNQFGGFVACREMIGIMSKQQPRLPPLEFNCSDFQYKPSGGGDLTGMLGVQSHEITEDNALEFIPKSNLPILEANASFTRNPLARNNLVVFHDSFGLALKSFLGYHFGKVTYCSQETLDAGLISREEPLVVVTEMVERHLNAESPAKLRAADNLSEIRRSASPVRETGFSVGIQRGE